MPYLLITPLQHCGAALVASRWHYLEQLFKLKFNISIVILRFRTLLNSLKAGVLNIIRERSKSKLSIECNHEARKIEV